MADLSTQPQLTEASAQQRAFWLADEVVQGAPTLNIPRLLLLEGAIDKTSLARAFNALIARHEVLRTGLVEVGGVVLQQVQDQITCVVEEWDFGALAEPERRANTDALTVQLCQTAFNLAVPPHFRTALIRLAEEEHLLVIVFHHAIIDGSSMGTFFAELAHLYESGKSGRSADLPELTVQYTDFAERQRRLFAQANFQQSVAFWKKTLAGAPPLLALPTARPRPAVQNNRGSRVAFEVDEHLTHALNTLCARHGATLFVGLLSAFQVLLQRWADTDDIVIGTPVSASRDEDLAPLIGCFMNTLALRCDLGGDATFVDLLAQNRSTLLDALEHQQVPFEQVVAELSCPRVSDHSPLFQVMFVLQNFRHGALGLAGLNTREIEVDPGIAKLDLTLEIVEASKLACSFEYDSALFDQPMIARLAVHFRRILEAAVATPDQPVGRIRLLNDQEWHREVYGRNATAREYLQRSPAQAFAATVAEHPHDTALISGDHSISFSELARRAEQVVTMLRRRAVDGTEPVGVFLPRSTEAFAAVLGCLIAGVPWLPLDTAQPDARLAQLVDLAGCRVALTLRGLAERLPEGLATITMDPDAPLWSEPVVAIETSPTTDLAYVLFTSGSTGVPKGVMGTTKALMNRIDWMNETYPFVPGEVACCKTSIAFVDSVCEMLGALLAGMPTVIVPDEIVLDSQAFIALLARHRVTRIVLVPTLLRMLLDEAPDLGQRLPNLTTWSVSGEVLPSDLARRFSLACPGRTLINIYGSSEVAADVLFHEIRDTDIDDIVPIGRPLANTQVHVLDRTGQPAPVGLPGAIHVGGICLAQGYWRRPDLTAERFKTNPISGTPSALLFDTGDRGVRREDGAILYLGRSDSQVKLRGVRLELGEIVAALRDHMTVREAAVVIVGEAERQRLIAFAVGHQGAKSPDPVELRAYLQKRLPTAAVPAKLLVLDALPLLPSGKVDLVTLRSFGEASPQLEPSRELVAVNTDVAEIWRAVLGSDTPTAADNFFAYGGNSLLAMQVVARVRRRFSIDIPIRALFDNPTLADFSKAVETAPPVADAGLTEIRPQPRSRAQLQELRERLVQLSPEELDALIRDVKHEAR